MGLDKQTLKKRNADSSAGWSPLNDEVSLGEQGFNAKSAKAEEVGAPWLCEGVVRFPMQC